MPPVHKPDRATVCLCCWKRKKRENYQFCSKKCTDIAAKKAPQLLRCPKDHIMYKDVAKSFRQNWKHASKRLPTIRRIYLVTWTPKLRSSFDDYRAKVAKKLGPNKKPKEVKRFRAETRYCRLGDPGKSKKLCTHRDCRLCRAIKTGFRSSLDYKRDLIKQGKVGSSRFGGGIYMAPASSKTYKYAINAGGARKKYRAIFSTRVVLGKSQIVHWDNWRRSRPDPGYDSVEAHPVNGGATELVVFNSNCVRPAYLIIVE